MGIAVLDDLDGPPGQSKHDKFEGRGREIPFLPFYSQFCYQFPVVPLPLRVEEEGGNEKSCRVTGLGHLTCCLHSLLQGGGLFFKGVDYVGGIDTEADVGSTAVF